MIGIVVAMESELAPYLDKFTAEKKNFCGKDFYLTNIGGRETVIVHSGVGKVNAAYATTLLICRYQPDVIISTGISGGLGRSKLLETVVASATVQHDVDTTALGDEKGFVSTVNMKYFHTDEKLSGYFAEALGAKKGVLASGDQFVADVQKGKEIAEAFDAIACDMESGAIGQTAYVAGIPFAAIRCISDGADGEAAVSFTQMLGKADKILADGVIAALTAM